MNGAYYLAHLAYGHEISGYETSGGPMNPWLMLALGIIIGAGLVTLWCLARRRSR